VRTKVASLLEFRRFSVRYPPISCFRAGKVEREIQRMLERLGYGAVRRVAAEVNPDVWIGLSIDDDRCRDVDIGAIKRRQFLRPVGALEIQE
jgi:hypothetical protein